MVDEESNFLFTEFQGHICIYIFLFDDDFTSNSFLEKQSIPLEFLFSSKRENFGEIFLLVAIRTDQ